MDRVRVSKSILSITSPGTHPKHSDHTLTTRITRETNTEISHICTEHPDRFAFFASLPVPDIPSTLAEIDFVLTSLPTAPLGFALLTNTYGTYLGDPSLSAVYAKLDSHHATLFLHPTQCHSLTSPDAAPPLSHFPPPWLEFMFDTTRAVFNLLLSGTVDKYPNLTFIIPHAGAAVPSLVARVASVSMAWAAADGKDYGVSMSIERVKELLRTRFYFDLAGYPFPNQVHGLLRVAGPERWMYGSDFPYTTGPRVEKLSEIMDKGLEELFDEETIRAIYAGNAKAFFRV
jgi:predicted TIM-barrel fold metal-dependent hydrolase